MHDFRNTSRTLTPLRLIGSPYQFGTKGSGMANGPLALLAADAVPAALAERGVDATVEWIDADEPGDVTLLLPAGDQLARTMHQNLAIQAAVAAARERQEVPVLATGVCNTALGVLGGIDDDGLGVIWIDGHADASTPETSASGFFDGMPVAIINGQCWQALRESIPGFHTVPAERIVSVGMHDLQPGRPGPIGAVVDRAGADAAGSWAARMTEALDVLAEHTDRVYLHIDVDSLSADVAAVHRFAVGTEGGMTAAEMHETIDLVFDRFRVAAVNVSAFDPAIDSRALPIVTSVAAHAGARAAGAER